MLSWQRVFGGEVGARVFRGHGSFRSTKNSGFPFYPFYELVQAGEGVVL